MTNFIIDAISFQYICLLQSIWIILGFIQPDVLFDQLQKNDSDGYMARMLISTPRTVTFFYNDFTSLESAEDTFDTLLTAVKSQNNQGGKFVMSKEAMDVFRPFYDELTEETSKKCPLLQGDILRMLHKGHVSNNIIYICILS